MTPDNFICGLLIQKDTQNSDPLLNTFADCLISATTKWKFYCFLVLKPISKKLPPPLSSLLHRLRVVPKMLASSRRDRLRQKSAGHAERPTVSCTIRT